MAEILVPDQSLIRDKQWTPPIRSVAVNRSEFSGQSKDFATNVNSPWRMQGRVRTLVTQEQRRLWHLFMRQAANRSNYFKVEKRCKQYRGTGVTTNITVDGAGQTTEVLLIKGCPPSQLVLRPGQYATVPISATRVLLAVCAFEIFSNAAGLATIGFSENMVLPALDNAPVELNNPYMFARLNNPEVGFSEAGGVMNISLDCEEYV